MSTIRTKPFHYIRPHDISVYSKRRKKPIFSVTQKHPYNYLWIDGERVKRTRVNTTYWFHMVDGVIDHYWAAPVGNHKITYKLPGYCEGCAASPMPPPASDDSLETMEYIKALKDVRAIKSALKDEYKDPMKGYRKTEILR